ncbi:UDP-N-acetylmuramoyl-L-alanyl-D-glutamate--2,6-diaminopimelate ligase [Enemella sp. A6]|uniref:UDP-N-acetylmuramoyl-L-alanyl-D-glutamate--2, 6-diaminopimelate ligase n=1 Tax=Enemella sp. A6 TaxID=3440152 RepID=UPI003EBDA4FA
MVQGINLDSRFVTPGDLYVALPGTRTHGARFGAQAVEAGAVAVLTDTAGAGMLTEVDVPVLTTDDPRAAMAKVAAVLFDRPTEKLDLFGVTGTNGKTTTVAILDAALQAAGRHSATIGTMGFTVDGRQLGGSRTTVTTPESIDLQALFAVMQEAGAQDVAMEVSSHALALHRVDEVRFEVAGFTNLGRDHLDFHHTMAEYAAAKARLFTPEFTRQAVITIDDDGGADMAHRARTAGLDVRTASLTDPGADYRADARVLDDGRWQLRVHTPAGSHDCELALPGRHNVANALLAVAMLDLAGRDLEACLPGLARVQVPGRMQRVALTDPAPAVYVDFAHTPQAVGATLDAFGERSGRLITVLGCGGDRDREKREPMGRIAAERSEIVVVTDDNPRSEPPESIRAQVLAGARQGSARVLDGGDRAGAIREALRLAEPGDIVAVLGKGHEQGQDIKGEIVPFDDVTEVTTAWQELG